jgi:hypothetical protein
MASNTHEINIELAGGFDPAYSILKPGDRISGQVFLRNSKDLSVQDVRITLYGISESTIFRNYPGVKFLYWFGRGFFF